jgi:hypothetical protein
MLMDKSGIFAFETEEIDGRRGLAGSRVMG